MIDIKPLYLALLRGSSNYFKKVNGTSCCSVCYNYQLLNQVI